MRALILLPLMLIACSEAKSPQAPPAQPVTTSTIPAAFQGRWGINAADCDPGRADNKGLLTITAGQLKFYESRGTPMTITQTGDTLALGLNLSGEGQTWSTKTELRLVDGGSALVRREPDPAGEFRYRRCV